MGVAHSGSCSIVTPCIRELGSLQKLKICGAIIVGLGYIALSFNEATDKE
jgi:hypothetical protein